VGVVTAGLAIASILLSLAPAFAAIAGEGTEAAIPQGAGRFVYDGGRSAKGEPIPVWTFRPTRYGKDSPIVFVFHGINREAYAYRDEWARHAESRNFLLVVPEFSIKAFPGPTYPQGRMFDVSGRPVDRRAWGYAAVEALFDRIRSMTGNTSSEYLIYGHSAGAQFVHRMVLFMPEARVRRAVAANSGYYTLPVQSEDFPYGLRKAPVGAARVAAAFRKDLVVLLGEEDTSSAGPDLNKSPGAMRQGKCRLDRGRNFFAVARAEADRRKVPLAWSLQTVPGVGHSNAKMAVAAAQVLFETGVPAATASPRK
jgi:pimeloyl-ACP methyl ester carboxylesterase